VEGRQTSSSSSSGSSSSSTKNIVSTTLDDAIYMNRNGSHHSPLGVPSPAVLRTPHIAATKALVVRAFLCSV